MPQRDGPKGSRGSFSPPAVESLPPVGRANRGVLYLLHGGRGGQPSQTTIVAQNQALARQKVSGTFPAGQEGLCWGFGDVANYSNLVRRDVAGLFTFSTTGRLSAQIVEFEHA